MVKEKSLFLTHSHILGNPFEWSIYVWCIYVCTLSLERVKPILRERLSNTCQVGFGLHGIGECISISLFDFF